MKYVLINKDGEREMELRIHNKDSQFIEGDIYKVYDEGKHEPCLSSYHMGVNLRYEGICNIKYNGVDGDSSYYACGVEGMLNHMRVYSFLSKIALMESSGSKYYVANFGKIDELGLLNGYTVEFIEEETHIPTRCKSCCYLNGLDCTRKSLKTNEIGVCWFEEEY